MVYAFGKPKLPFTAMTASKESLRLIGAMCISNLDLKEEDGAAGVIAVAEESKMLRECASW